jgi:hypothetical protein
MGARDGGSAVGGGSGGERGGVGFACNPSEAFELRSADFSTSFFIHCSTLFEFIYSSYLSLIFTVNYHRPLQKRELD